MLHLHRGEFGEARRLEQCIQNIPDMRSRQLYVLGDFQPSELKYQSNYLQILSDTRIAEHFSYLISGIESAEKWVCTNFPNFQSTLTYFFMSGTGPSPFNATLGDIYLKVGHYNPVSHDREIVQHAIIHEMTHIYLRNQIGFKIRQDEFGIRKFFDEGFAQYCGFQSINACKRKLAHADACSSVVVKRNPRNLIDRINSWQRTVFKEKHYPMYQASFSFIGYLEEAIGFYDLLQLFRNANGESSFPDVIQRKTGAVFTELLKSWIDQLDEPGELSEEEFFQITKSARVSNTCLQVGYQSMYPLYPVKNILVLNESGEQLEVAITRSKRYQKTGEFNIFPGNCKTLSLTIVFDDHIQKVEINDGV